MKIPFFPNVDSILADFTSAVSKLEALADLYDTRANGLSESAARTFTKANKVATEATRARTIASKINQLIS